MKYDRYIDLLLKYNKVHKITGAKTKDEVLEHIKDSIEPFDRFKDKKSVLDIGTGAGFPGLILAMEYPKTRFYLVEPLQKRVAFLTLVVATYGLKNVTILPMRVEEIEPFEVDLITSRAVTEVKTLLELSKNFLKEGVELLLYKGENVVNEIKDLDLKYEYIKRKKGRYLKVIV